jgi:hypothetical protein
MQVNHRRLKLTQVVYKQLVGTAQRIKWVCDTQQLVNTVAKEWQPFCFLLYPLIQAHLASFLIYFLLRVTFFCFFVYM